MRSFIMSRQGWLHSSTCDRAIANEDRVCGQMPVMQFQTTDKRKHYIVNVILPCETAVHRFFSFTGFWWWHATAKSAYSITRLYRAFRGRHFRIVGLRRSLTTHVPLVRLHPVDSLTTVNQLIGRSGSTCWSSFSYRHARALQRDCR